MNIGIICAMEEEFELIHKNIEIKEIIEKASLKFYKGIFNDKEVVGVVCGIGKVNAAICTQILISEFSCTHIINSGVAGSLHDNIKFKDIVIAQDLIQHDVDVSAFGYKKGEIPKIGTHSFKCDETLLNIATTIVQNNQEISKDISFHKGRIITGDKFISDVNFSKNLHKEFNALACEMESASIAQTCYLNNIPFLIIRSISDNAGNIATNEFLEFLKEASQNSFTIIKSIIENI